MGAQINLDETYPSTEGENDENALAFFQEELFSPPNQDPAKPKKEGAEVEKPAQANKSNIKTESLGAWAISTDLDSGQRTLVLKKADGTKIEIEDLNGNAKIHVHAPFLKEDIIMNDLEAYGYSADGSFYATGNDYNCVYGKADGSLTKTKSPNVTFTNGVEEQTYSPMGTVSSRQLSFFGQENRNDELKKIIRNDMEKRNEGVVYEDRNKKTILVKQKDGTSIQTETIDNKFKITIHAPFLKEDLILDNQSSTHNGYSRFSSRSFDGITSYEQLENGDIKSETSYGLKILWKTDGTKVTHRPYGTVITEKPDGTKISELFTGHKITKKADGSYSIEMPDHKIVNWTAQNNGVRKEANGPETMTLPDGLKISHLTDGTAVYDWPDGRKVTEFADGRLQRITPYSVLIANDGSDKSLSALKYANTGKLIEQDGIKGTDNILEDDKEAQAMARLLEKELENTFHVTFSKPTDADYVIEQWDGSKKTRPHRFATLQELLVIREALYRSVPNNKFDNRGIRFAFLNGETFDTAQASFDEKTGVVNIPSRDIRDKIPWFHNDEKVYNLRLSTASFQAYMMHELAHNTTQRNNPTKGKDYYSKSQLAQYFGLKQITSLNGVPVWVTLVKQKSDGLNNDMYKVTNIGNNVYRAYRCDEHTGQIGNEGKITVEELRKRALVNPATFYMDDPEEIITEALVCLRIGGKTAAEVMRNSPLAYAKAKELDQDEIDFVYAASQKHPYGWMRGVNGYMVEKTPANLRAREDFESEALQNRI